MADSTQTVLLILLVTFIALVGGRRYRGRKGSPPLFRVTTLAYLALGLALGGQGLGMLEQDMLDNLEPVVGLSLGWIGILFGLQFEIKRLRRFHPRFFGVTLFQSLFTVVTLGGVMYLALGWFTSGGGGSLWRALLLIATVGAISSPAETVLATLASGGVKRKLARLVHYISSLDSFLPVVIFAFTVGLYHSRTGGGIVSALEWTAVSALIGLALGLLFYSYARHRHSENELAMMIIAFTVFSGGIAAYLNLSSLFINVVLGVVLANLLPTSERIFRVLVSRERPILIVLLVLVGANWIPFPQGRLVTVAALLAIYLAARVLGKAVSVAAARPFLREELTQGGWAAGLALLGQGGMSVALIANYQLLFGGAADTMAVSVVLCAVVLSEAFSAYAARCVLAGNDEEGG
jgi:hypothetical protein